MVHEAWAYGQEQHCEQEHELEIEQDQGYGYWHQSESVCSIKMDEKRRAPSANGLQQQTAIEATAGVVGVSGPPAAIPRPTMLR